MLFQTMFPFSARPRLFLCHHVIPCPRPGTFIPLRGLQNPVDIALQLRHGATHLARQHVPKCLKGAHLTANELVTTPYKFYELARVDVRVAAALDIFDELGGYLREGEGGVRGRTVERLEGGREGFSEERLLEFWYPGIKRG